VKAALGIDVAQVLREKAQEVTNGATSGAATNGSATNGAATNGSAPPSPPATKPQRFTRPVDRS
jgi:hypothetical protein